MRTWFCIDWPLDVARQRDAMLAALDERADNAPMQAPVVAGAPALVHVSMALDTTRLWQPGRTVRVAFVDGEAWQHELVASTAVTWSQYANIRFEFGVSPAESDVRIAFVPSGGSKSLVGTDCLIADRAQPTMNLGWIDSQQTPEELNGVILHEFGHALGCIHEHQNPGGFIPWDREKVYAEYAREPNHWSREEVDQQIFAIYDRNITRFSMFDRESIMLYPVPEELTIGDYSVDPNYRLSKGDQEFIAATYPRSVDPRSLTVNGGYVAGTIGFAGQVDHYGVTIGKGGWYLVETQGPTNVKLAIYGPDDPTRLVAGDDDSGRDGYNATIQTLLMAGSYSVRVQHQAGGGGDYGVRVLAKA
jgi:hypothetical protein